VEASALPVAPGLAPGVSLGLPLRMRSDEQLLALFRAGNEDAFSAIHDRYRQRLFAYTRQMLPGSVHDAEDALQDVFVRAYFSLRADGRKLALRAWLYRVAHNRCVDQLRRPPQAPPEALEPLRGQLNDPLAAAEQREALRRLVQDIRRLSEQQRSALLMRELSGMSYLELADALETTVPAVKSLLVRARIGLAQAAQARDTACSEIRHDLAEAHERGVRATGNARRHLRDCAGCREFRRTLRGVSRQLSALAPLGPAGALAKLLGVGGGGAASGAAASGGAGSSAAGGIFTAGGVLAGGATHAATLLAAAALAAGGAVELTHPPPIPSARSGRGAALRERRPAARAEVGAGALAVQGTVVIAVPVVAAITTTIGAPGDEPNAGASAGSGGSTHRASGSAGDSAAARVSDVALTMDAGSQPAAGASSSSSSPATASAGSPSVLGVLGADGAAGTGASDSSASGPAGSSSGSSPGAGSGLASTSSATPAGGATSQAGSSGTASTASGSGATGASGSTSGSSTSTASSASATTNASGSGSTAGTPSSSS
jgi:RNA polymerase sigma factor (sigma-70 family)